jgi:hypothetical protein
MRTTVPGLRREQTPSACGLTALDRKYSRTHVWIQETAQTDRRSGKSDGKREGRNGIGGGVVSASI